MAHHLEQPSRGAVVRLHLVVSRKRGVHRGLQAVVGCGRVGQPYDWYMHAVAQCCGLSPRHIGLRPCLHGLVAALEQRLAELEPHLAQREVLRRGEHQRDARRAHRVERRLPPRAVAARAAQQLDQHLQARIGGNDMLLLEAGGKGHLSGFEKAVLCLDENSTPPYKTHFQAGQMIPVSLQSVAGDQLQVAPLIAHSA